MIWPFNFEGDGLEMNFIKKSEFLGGAHLKTI